MWFIGSGYTSEAEHIAKCIVETVCIGSVNAFVLISGWFGIRSGMSKIGDLAFMISFCTLPLLMVALIFGWMSINDLKSLTGIYEYVLGGNNYWFVVDYIGLLIIAPLLNNGIKSFDKKQFATTLIAGYILIGVYDFIFRTPVIGTEGGYSLVWFVYLYLLARYLKIHRIERMEKYRWTLLISAVIFQSILFYYGYIGLRYTNPFIVIEAVCLIEIFKTWNFKSKTVNYAAKGALMAYLIHMQPVLIPYIARFLLVEYYRFGYFLYMVEVIVLAILIFVAAIPLNQLQSSNYHKLKSLFKKKC